MFGAFKAANSLVRSRSTHLGAREGGLAFKMAVQKHRLEVKLRSLGAKFKMEERPMTESKKAISKTQKA